MTAQGSPVTERDASSDIPDESPATVWHPGDRALLAFDLVLLAAVAGYLYLALDLGFGTVGRAGAGFFPTLAGAICGGFLLIDIGRLTLARRQGTWTPATGRLPFRAFMVLAAVGLYLVGVDILGHVITGSIVAGILITILGSRSVLATVVIGIAAGLGTDLLFSGLLGVGLPEGIWGIGTAAWI